MKPILFNTEMVKALLDGRKTVTRRIVKPQPENAHMIMDVAKDVAEFMCGKIENGYCIDFSEQRKLPYQPGDILYVRETFGWLSEENKYVYKASDFECVAIDGFKWSPSLHMPKEAARIFLRVTGVRVERLQEITEEQAVKEGVPADWPMDKVYCPICKGEGLIGAVHPVSLGFMEVECPHCEKGTSRFQNLWNSTIKPADLPLYGWDASPWVWVIGFEKISKEDAYNA